MNKFHDFIKQGFDKMHKEFRSTNHKRNIMMKISIISPFLLLFFTQVNAQSALKKIETFLKHAEEIKQVWPGYIKKFHHGIYGTDGTTYLALEAQDLEGWKKTKTVNNIPIWVKKDKTFKKFANLFFLNYPLQNDVLIDGAFNDKNAIFILFHESFHAFQSTLKPPLTKWTDISISDYISTIKDKEFAILYGLLKQKKDELHQFKKNIVLYVSIRKYRESLMNKNSVELERSMEWQEGVAAFVEYNIKHIIESNKPSIGPMLNDYGVKISNKTNSNKIEQFMRWSAYYHGSAICYLLDYFNPGWKAQIEQGKKPFDLLEETFRPAELNQGDIEKLLGIGKNINEKQLKQKIFNKYKEWKNILRFSSNNGESITYQPLYHASFENGTLVKNIISFHYENEMYKITGRAKSLFFENSEDSKTGNNIFKIKKLPKKPKTCKEISETQWLCEGGTRLKISGLKIDIKQKMNIHLANGVIQF
ncbi:MAG: hypothetical protein JKY19_01530 [Alcanivoracaceae bacterium]|nr:hypothetical protein [Alcanivoracaceae bacterium]